MTHLPLYTTKIRFISSSLLINSATTDTIGYLSINQSINLYRAIVQRRVLQWGYAESKRNVLRRILDVLTDGAVRQFSGREFQSLGAKQRNDEQQCPSCAAELTEASVWMIAASESCETDCSSTTYHSKCSLWKQLYMTKVQFTSHKDIAYNYYITYTEVLGLCLSIVVELRLVHSLSVGVGSKRLDTVKSHW